MGKRKEIFEKEEEIPSFAINQKFAQEYDLRKRTEEKARLEEEYGSNYDSESTIYSSEDSDAELATKEVDVAILKTLSRIRSKDPQIYDPSVNVFGREQSTIPTASTSQNKSRKSKPIKLKDVERQTLLGRLKDAKVTPAQEQADLRDETLAVFHADDSDDDLLTLRPQTKQSNDDDDSYKDWIEAQVGRKDIDKLFKDDDDFLRSYIMDRGWRDTKAHLVPTMTDIIDTEEEFVPSGANAVQTGALSTKKAYKALEEVDDSDDAEFEERNEEFETKYNFRFEEAGGVDLVTHARLPTETVRRSDDSRRQARQNLKDRKQVEKAEQKADLARLKALKRQEIVDKLSQIRQVAGLAAEGDGFDLEADFDEAAHAKQMAGAFGDEWYAMQDDQEKPTWDDDIDIADIIEQAASDVEEAYDPTEGSSKPKKSKRDKKRKKKAKAADNTEAIEAADNEDQVLDLDQDEQKALAEEIDEYYNLDFEDKIGDIKTRFNYVPVPQSINDLTPADILLLTDKELNSYVSLKKLAPFRQDGESMKQHTKKKKLKQLKSALSKRKWGEKAPTREEQVDLQMFNPTKKRKADPEAEAEISPEKKSRGRMGKKERLRRAADLATTEDAVPDPNE